MVYAVVEIFSSIILLMLAFSLKRIGNYSDREKWFTRAIEFQSIYFIGDTVWALSSWGIIPATFLSSIALTVYLTSILNLISVAIFYYFCLSAEYKFSNTRKKRVILAIPAFLVTVVEWIIYLIHPGLFITGDGQTTRLFSTVFVFVPFIYSLAAIGLALYGTVSNHGSLVKKFYLMLGSYPMIMVVSGIIDIINYSEIPIYCLTATAYLVAIYVYYLNSTVEHFSLDSLTGLKNRENLHNYVKKLWNNHTEEDYYLFMIDMNGLKAVNDVYGHLEGDNAIKAISQALDYLLTDRNEGVVCRYGGDEFVAVVKIENDDQAEKFSQILRERVHKCAEKMHMRTSPQIAVGYTRLDGQEKDLSPYLKKADEKMYAEKLSMKSGDERGKFLIDEVTGLPNANYYRSFAASCLKKMLNEGKHPVVILFDVAGMHVYNDRFGYEAGDQLLIDICKILKNIFLDDVLVRYTDDRFVVLTDEDALQSKVEKAISGVSIISKKRVASLKAGIYYYDNSEESPIAAVDKARRALQYISGNRHVLSCVYDDKVKESFESRDYIIGHFREALHKGWIQPYFQPEVRSLTGKICSFEVLARWVDPVKGILPQEKFIGALEESHLVQYLDLYIIRQAISQLHDRLMKHKLMVPISINLSRIDFKSCDIFKEVENIRSEYDVPSSYLKVEILESALSLEPELLKDAMNKFHAHGYEIWMDDFGSGYSSFNNLKDFNFDILKIDMKFLQNFDKNSRSRVILSSIVDMAKKLRIGTVCEGVETKEQSDYLKEIGCERQQGFYFSKPIPLVQVNKLLSQGKSTFELQNENNYYDQIGKINVLCNPLSKSENSGAKTGIMILECEAHKQINCLYANQAVRELFTQMDLISNSNILNLMNKCNQSLKQTMDRISLNKQNFIVKMKKIATNKSSAAYICVFEKIK